MTFFDSVIVFIACFACHYWGYGEGFRYGYRTGWRWGLRQGRGDFDTKQDKEAE